MTSASNPIPTDVQTRAHGDDRDVYIVALERATRGLLELNVAVLESMQRTVGLEPIRALQSLERRGPSLVTELGDDMDLVPSTASRLSERLADAGLITRRTAPTNRRATVLELTDAGHEVLDELVALRWRALSAVTELMVDEDREALLQGAHAFTAARARLGDGDRP
jgi:DNA-binding MarR family transcriptional regulator